MACFSPLRGYVARGGGFTFRKADSNGNKMTVPCGGCLGCRHDRSKMWASRIVHEASLHDENCFITLTYRPEDRPFPPSVRKEDFQKFMKRLRKNVFSDRKIKYFHCGEYGENGPGHHPHYHACIFNADFPDRVPYSEREGIITYTSRILEKEWQKGFVTVGDVTYETAAYTARYCFKKITGTRAHDHYLFCDTDGVAYDLEPEYITMSNGIGKEWYEKFKSDVFPSDEIPVPGKGVFKKAPRYYENLLEKDDPECLEDIKARRMEFVKANQKEYTPERLESKFRVEKSKLDQLKRGFT